MSALNNVSFTVNGTKLNPVPKTTQRPVSAFEGRKVDSAVPVDQPLIPIAAIVAKTVKEITPEEADSFTPVKKKDKHGAAAAAGSSTSRSGSGSYVSQKSGRGRGSHHGNRGSFWDHNATQRRGSVPNIAAVVNGKPLTAAGVAATAAAIASKAGFEKETREKEAGNTGDSPGTLAAAAYVRPASASASGKDRPSTAPDNPVAPRFPRSVRTKSDSTDPAHLLSHSSSRGSLNGSGRSSVSVGLSSNGSSPSCTPKSGASPAAGGWAGRQVPPLTLERALGGQAFHSIRREGNGLVLEEDTAASQAEVEADIKTKFASFAAKVKPYNANGQSPRTPSTPATPVWGAKTPQSARTTNGSVFLYPKSSPTAADASAAGGGSGAALAQADSKAAAANAKEMDAKTVAAGAAAASNVNVVQHVFNKYAFGKVYTLEPQEARQITFSQRAVSCYTNDGSGIESLYGRFLDGEEDDVEPIDVIVRSGGDKVSFDNRRLFAYRLAQREQTDAKIRVIFRRLQDKADKQYTWQENLDYRLQNPYEPALGETENNPLPSYGVSFSEVCLRDNGLKPSGELSTNDWIWK
jgi:hypothetical protein